MVEEVLGWLGSFEIFIYSFRRDVRGRFEVLVLRIISMSGSIEWYCLFVGFGFWWEEVLYGYFFLL